MTPEYKKFIKAYVMKRKADRAARMKKELSRIKREQHRHYESSLARRSGE